MKANLLKLKRKHPFWFELFYQDEINRRRTKIISKRVIGFLEQKAEEYWGWDIDREAYDACIIAMHVIRETSNRIENELS